MTGLMQTINSLCVCVYYIALYMVIFYFF